MSPSITVGFPHAPLRSGGPGSFQTRLMSELRALGHTVVLPESRITPDVIVVVGGTQKIAWLWRCKARGARVVHRLGGMNWRHCVMNMPRRVHLLGIARNRVMAFIRNHLADYVVYQSEFVQDWWHTAQRSSNCPERVIYNGVDLNEFTPARRKENCQNQAGLLCVEGNIDDDPVVLDILTSVSEELTKIAGSPSVRLYGRVSNSARERLDNVDGISMPGTVLRDEMPDVYSRGRAFLSLDVNAACPNTVIESLASGLPVVGFDTGALPELVPSEAGIIVPFGGDPWQLQRADTKALVSAASDLLSAADGFRLAARAVAEERFGLDKMVESYMDVFNQVLDGRQHRGVGS